MLANLLSWRGRSFNWNHLKCSEILNRVEVGTESVLKVFKQFKSLWAWSLSESFWCFNNSWFLILGSFRANQLKFSLKFSYFLWKVFEVKITWSSFFLQLGPFFLIYTTCYSPAVIFQEINTPECRFFLANKYSFWK